MKQPEDVKREFTGQWLKKAEELYPSAGTRYPLPFTLYYPRPLVPAAF